MIMAGRGHRAPSLVPLFALLVGFVPAAAAADDDDDDDIRR